MAPDKIYLGIGPMSGDEPNKRYLYPEWYEEPKRPLVQNVEYIRKDALLEWAKERREAVAKEVVIQEGVRLGADAAFEELIDKLNEM